MKTITTVILGAALALALTSAAQAAGMKPCGYQHAAKGQYYWHVTANHNTSCGLARNVAFDSGYTIQPTSYSSATHRYYQFYCYRSGHTYYERRYTCVSYEGTDGPLRVVIRG